MYLSNRTYPSSQAVDLDLHTLPRLTTLVRTEMRPAGSPESLSPLSFDDAPPSCRHESVLNDKSNRGSGTREPHSSKGGGPHLASR